MDMLTPAATTYAEAVDRIRSTPLAELNPADPDPLRRGRGA